MPMLTESEAMNVPVMVRVRELQRMLKGMMKQVTNIVQKYGAYGPRIFA